MAETRQPEPCDGECSAAMKNEGWERSSLNAQNNVENWKLAILPECIGGKRERERERERVMRRMATEEKRRRESRPGGVCASEA